MDTGKRRVDGTRESNMILDQIMLRYRPIAPRPVNAEGSGQSFPASEGLVNRKRAKHPSEKVTNWISFGGNEFESVESGSMEMMTSDLHGGEVGTAVERRTVTESWITVEAVTGTCDGRKLLGYSDEEIWKNLEGDTCPCFVSNSFDEVVWVNQAYKRLLDLDGGDGGDVAVWLVLKVDRSVVVKYLPAFSCSVRVEYRLLSEKKMWMIVPCDVCAMDSGGGFAWRLDVVSALSLGPIN
ncbi:hypothetical protein CTI12_AA181380 [Artemisia annua]|uniref:DUF7950 domain-containing protein n=1 Tax=Artemisia annua TaxID=35608 RepID=A0A2U1P8B7_ARTAN|nr:hypothetical protein CTI12_AA181380 [Artemisia annua]